MTTDPAEAGRTTDGAGIVLPALENWLEYRDLTEPARGRELWRKLLDQPLPAEPAGFETALAELAEHVIPNGLPVGAPAFNAFITTGPTTAPALAQFAAAIASPQRYGVSAFNLLEEVSLRWLAGALRAAGRVARRLLQRRVDRQHPCAGRSQAVGVRGPRVRCGPGRAARHLRGVLYASSESHHSVQRAAAVLGLGRDGGTQRPG